MILPRPGLPRAEKNEGKGKKKGGGNFLSAVIPSRNPAPIRFLGKVKKNLGEKKSAIFREGPGNHVACRKEKRKKKKALLQGRRFARRRPCPREKKKKFISHLGKKKEGNLHCICPEINICGLTGEEKGGNRDRKTLPMFGACLGARRGRRGKERRMWTGIRKQHTSIPEKIKLAHPLPGVRREKERKGREDPGLHPPKRVKTMRPRFQ